MSKLENQSDENRLSEGGMFYPTGYLVAGFDTADMATVAEQALINVGFPTEDVTRVSAADMARQAGENLEEPGFIASIGAAVHIRQKQLDLAKDGCEFLLIKASDDDEEERALSALSTAPVRYAVKYRTLIIENMLPMIPSSTPDPEPARATGSSR